MLLRESPRISTKPRIQKRNSALRGNEVDRVAVPFFQSATAAAARKMNNVLVRNLGKLKRVLPISGHDVVRNGVLVVESGVDQLDRK